jgi:subtilase family serine protease
VITSGGGFSLFNSLPSWQSTAVNSYFSSNKNNIPSSGYRTNARGYPDISALGANYFVILNGNGYLVSGTSASAPVVAGMISLVNAARVSRGQSTLVSLIPGFMRMPVRS